MELLQKLQQQIYPTGANKENAAAQKKPNFLEKKKLLDYADHIEGDKGKASGATVLGSSTTNKRDAYRLQDDNEEEEDDYDNEPWEKPDVSKGKIKQESAPAAKANPFDQKVKSAFDDLDDDFNFGGAFDSDPQPKAKETVTKQQPQLSELLNHQS